MNDFQRANIRRQLIRALKIAGAMPCTVTRIERDANGMPTGREIEVARLYGLRYQRVSQLGDLLQMAMPGIVAKDSGGWRWIGLATYGDPPMEGDTLRGSGMDAIRSAARLTEGMQSLDCAPKPSARPCAGGWATAQIVGVQESLGVIQLTLGGTVT